MFALLCQGGERVERGLKALRGAWEEEVNELVADARRDVECAEAGTAAAPHHVPARTDTTCT